MSGKAVPFGILPFFRSGSDSTTSARPGRSGDLAHKWLLRSENDQGEQFGVERMKEVIRASRKRARLEIIAQLYGAVTKFSNGTKQQ